MIYLAAPLFNEFERNRNFALASALENFEPIFLPQRDGGLLVDAVRAGEAVDAAETEVFLRDVAAIDRSSLMVAVLDGAVVDEGVAFELGYAFAQGISCVGLQTDSRRQLPTGNNPMIGRCLAELFTNDSTLINWIRDEFSQLDRRASARSEQRPRMELGDDQQ